MNVERAQHCKRSHHCNGWTSKGSFLYAGPKQHFRVQLIETTKDNLGKYN